MSRHPSVIRSAIAAALAIGIVAPTTAHAAAVTATGTVTGSTLSATTAATPTFSANVDLGDSFPTYTIPLTVQDSRGNGSGWNVTVTSTTFTTGGGTPSLLATNASSLTGITSACASGTCTNPTNALTYPVTVPAASTAPAAVKFFNAAVNTGMGRFTVTPTVTVFVPQNTFAGTYSSTVTLSIVSGP
jgi:hypothetical protein